MTIQGKTAEELKLISAPITATVIVRFFQDIRIRLWNWMVLIRWISSVTTKKKHQVNMQKTLNVLKLEGFSSSDVEATRLKTVQLDRISNVRTINSGLLKSRASRTITGMVPVSNLESRASFGVSNDPPVPPPLDLYKESVSNDQFPTVRLNKQSKLQLILSLEKKSFFRVHENRKSSQVKKHKNHLKHQISFLDYLLRCSIISQKDFKNNISWILLKQRCRGKTSPTHRLPFWGCSSALSVSLEVGANDHSKKANANRAVFLLL